MIARLKGLVDAIGDDHAVIDVGGVGYLVYASTRTLSALPPVGEAVHLEIETHVREDHINLYGFSDAAEREMFTTLLGVQGVGARVAQAVLSVLAPPDIAQAIAAEDKAAIGQANGVGPRLAGRIVSELKDKVAAPIIADRTAASAGPPAQHGPSDDAISALVNLGYRPTEAQGAVVAARGKLGDDADLAKLIRAGLKELSR